MKKLNFACIILLCGSMFAQTEVTTLTTEIEGSGGLCLDADGNLYIADFGDSLGGPDPDGIPNEIKVLDTNQNLSLFATGFIGASGNNFDNSGTLYQSDIWDSGIYKIVGGVRTFVTNDGIVAPVGVVFDSNDNFYVCNCGNNTIRKVTPGGVSTMYSSGPEFACPNGITIDEDDNLYVVNFSNTNVVKVDTNGTPSIIANAPSGNGHIDYDPVTKNLYIASFAGQQIFYVNKDNPVLTVLAGTAGLRGNDDGPVASATFSNPNGVAVTQTGDSIYVNSAVNTTGADLNPQYIRLITGVLDFLSTEDNTISYDVKTYPNPVTNEFTIETDLHRDHSNLVLTIFDITGKKLLERTDIETSTHYLKSTVDISNFASGTYFYTLSEGGAQLFNGKLIKR